MTVLTGIWFLLHQQSIKNMYPRLAHRLIMLWHFLNWGYLLENNSGLWQVNIKSIQCFSALVISANPDTSKRTFFSPPDILFVTKTVAYNCLFTEISLYWAIHQSLDELINRCVCLSLYCVSLSHGIMVLWNCHKYGWQWKAKDFLF